ncbi:MAG TPA: hypothetical protein VJ044_17015, partial [Candidatus Hodarchaeales archaeon]|nr:hypothetical protein [Candidatus Hodarchaeales archaeon]
MMKLFVTNPEESEKMVLEVDSRTGEPMLLGKIPMMVMSEFCNLHGLSASQLNTLREDPREFGGYFIVKGKEYCIISQENKAENFIYRNIDRTGEASVWIQSRRSQYQYPYYTTVKYSKGQVYVTISISKSKGQGIPMRTMYNALGVTTDREIYDLIAGQDIESSILESFQGISLTQEEAILQIASEKSLKMEQSDIIKYTYYEIVEKSLFPHLGGAENLRKKITLLSYMVRSVVNLHLGLEEPIEKDNYGNKRVLTSGYLYGQLFRHFFAILMKEFNIGIKKELESFNLQKDYSGLVARWFHNSKKLELISKHLNTGEWPAGSTKGYKKKEGVSQQLERKSTMDPIMTLQKVVAPITDSGVSNIGIRKLDNSQ